MEDVISAPQTELSILWQQVLPANSRSFSTDTSTCILLWSARRSFHSCVLVNAAKAVSNDSTDLFCLPLSSAEKALGRAAVGENSSVETASSFVEDTEDHMIFLCFQYCISMNVSSILISIAKTHAKTTAILIHFTCKQNWAAFSLCSNATSGNHKLESAALDALKEPFVEYVHNWREGTGGSMRTLRLQNTYMFLSLWIFCCKLSLLLVGI